jgi:hypothetical protein
MGRVEERVLERTMVEMGEIARSWGRVGIGGRRCCQMKSQGRKWGLGPLGLCGAVLLGLWKEREFGC